jgi:hypothetical protein
MGISVQRFYITAAMNEEQWRLSVEYGLPGYSQLPADRLVSGCFG